MRFLFLAIILSFFTNTLKAQSRDVAFIKISTPARENNTVKTARQFITGTTCKDCTLSINGNAVTVYATGAFAWEANLQEGDSTFTILANGASGKVISKKIIYTFTKPEKPVPVSKVAIESIDIYPDGNLLVKPGDKINFKVKALPGSKVSVIDETPLYELPVKFSGGMAGIYQGTYTVKTTDNFNNTKLQVKLTSPDGFTITGSAKKSVTFMTPDMPDIGITNSNMAYMEYGLGEDRLGGARIGYLDEGVQLQIAGKVDNDYKIRLAANRTAFVPAEFITLMPKGSLFSSGLTGSWKVYGDDKFDYVNIGLPGKLPYQSKQLINPSRIVIDIFGAVSNTNWITQLQNTKEVTSVDYEQVSDDIYRVYISLKHPQHWGHQLYYQGNILVIKIRHQPANLNLSNLTIAIDAGHGGTNNGATGITGAQEKNLTLPIAFKLQQSLVAAGAKVLMTRASPAGVNNEERLVSMKDALPDLLISIHLNSAGDPIRVQGTSTYYNHIGFKPLSSFIYKRILELGLKEFGNIGSFNFIFNRPTEYPNALVETVFISNPEDEMKILDEQFQQQMADKIVLGIKDFLANAGSAK